MIVYVFFFSHTVVEVHMKGTTGIVSLAVVFSNGKWLLLVHYGWL